MKTRILSAIAVAAAALSVACTPEEKVIPEFPETMDDITVNAGETATVTINPNMAWEAVLSASTSDFWFGEQDETLKRKSISGEAGETVLTVSAASGNREPVSCDLSLVMGGETKKIVTITALPLEDSFVIYSAIWNEETGSYETDATGEYVYNETESASEIALHLVKVSDTECNFECPVKVVSTYEWVIKEDQDPEWLSTVATTEAGVSKFIIKADNRKYPEGGAEGEAVITSTTDSEIEPYKINISIPDYKKAFYAEGLLPGTAIDVDHSGLTSDKPYMIWSAKDGGIAFACCSIDENGAYTVLAKGDWLDANKEEPAYKSEGMVANTAKLFISVAKNDSEEPRKGAVVVITADKYDEWMTDESKWNEAIFDGNYKPHAGTIVIPVNQAGSAPVISPVEDEEALAEKEAMYSIVSKDDYMNNWMYREWGPAGAEVNSVYSVVYGAAKTRIEYNVNVGAVGENYSWEIKHSDKNAPDGECKPVESEDWWIKVEKGENGKLFITLDPVTGNQYWDEANPSETDKYKLDRIGDDPYKMVYEGFVVIKNSDGEPVAVVWCKMDETARFGPMFSFEDKAPVGVTLTKKTLEDYDGLDIEYIKELRDIIEGEFAGLNEIYELKISQDFQNSDTKVVDIRVPSENSYSHRYNEDKGHKPWYGFAEKKGTNGIFSFDFTGIS